MSTSYTSIFAGSGRSPIWDTVLFVGCKRGFDLFASALLLVLLAPLCVVLAVGVKLSSRWSIFYRWKVVGRGGRPLTGYKFRSMLPNADELKGQVESLNEMRGPVFKLTRTCEQAGMREVEVPL